MCYRSTELAEYSCVAVPGNQECLTLTEARTILAVVKRGLTLPADLIKRAEEKVHKPIRHALMKDSSGWHVIDGDGGIVISTRDARTGSIGARQPGRRARENGPARRRR